MPKILSTPRLVQKGSAGKAPEKAGKVDKITVNGKEMSTDDWETYALSNYPDFIKNTKFFIDGDEVPLIIREGVILRVYSSYTQSRVYNFEYNVFTLSQNRVFLIFIYKCIFS